MLGTRARRDASGGSAGARPRRARGLRREGERGGGLRGADLGGAVAEGAAEDDAQPDRQRGGERPPGAALGSEPREPGELERGDRQGTGGEGREGVPDDRAHVDPRRAGGDGGLIVERRVEVTEEGDLGGDREPEEHGDARAEAEPGPTRGDEVEEGGAGGEVQDRPRVGEVERGPAQPDVERGELRAEDRVDQALGGRHRARVSSIRRTTSSLSGGRDRDGAAPDEPLRSPRRKPCRSAPCASEVPYGRPHAAALSAVLASVVAAACGSGGDVGASSSGAGGGSVVTGAGGARATTTSASTSTTSPSSGVTTTTTTGGGGAGPRARPRRRSRGRASPRRTTSGRGSPSRDRSASTAPPPASASG